jgi:SAM-dependent methyltransferase
MERNLDDQRRQWEDSFACRPDMFGAEPSAPALAAARLFKTEHVATVLELGGGQGRDTLFFARQGFEVNMLDYSEKAVETVDQRAHESGLSGAVTVLRRDVRQPLPFPDGFFDACYSHMLFCMALTAAELEFLSSEVRRVLRPGGLHIYTVRHTGDEHYGKGLHRGENIYEFGGFAVHFFSRETVHRLAAGFRILGIYKFEEGALPRRLFRVTLRRLG